MSLIVKLICFQLWNVFVSNCKMYLFQILKCICLNFWDVFVLNFKCICLTLRTSILCIWDCIIGILSRFVIDQFSASLYWFSVLFVSHGLAKMPIVGASENLMMGTPYFSCKVRFESTITSQYISRDVLCFITTMFSRKWLKLLQGFATTVTCYIATLRCISCAGKAFKSKKSNPTFSFHKSKPVLRLL